MTAKQIDLAGKLVSNHEQEDDEREDLAILKSVLQKSIRRADVEKAMYFALRLAEKNWWTAWRRLGIVGDEDCEMPEVILVVDVLYRRFMAMHKGSKEKELSWDERRCVVLAAKLLAQSWKDRQADEFLELLQATEKQGDKVPELKQWRDEIGKVPDFALDVHTKTGRAMGRGNAHWLEISSQTELRTVDYEIWRESFEPLMRKVYCPSSLGQKEKRVKA